MNSSEQSTTVAISWSSLSYFTTPSFFGFISRSSSPSNSNPKVLLRELHGSFSSGTLNGLLGPSGSGKSTLLNCLSGNLQNNSDGQVTAESVIIRPSNKIVVFLEQFAQQSVHQQLTVRQLLRYAFFFKNKNINNKTTDELFTLLTSRIKVVMATLMLDGDEELLNRRFADLSGGQQKRVVIAQELMVLESSSVASLLILDEPVTGLDSAAALEVVRALKTLAEVEGLCIICSIHQPNGQILALFDQLYVLSKGGRLLYDGPPDEVEHAIKGHIREDNETEDQTPIEALLKLASSENPRTLRTTITIKRNQRQIKPQQVQKTLTTKSHQNPFTSFSTHLHRQLLLTFIASYRLQLIYVLLYLLNYLLVSRIFSWSSAAAAGCVTANSNSSSCEMSFEEEISFKENAFSLCYSVLYVGLLTIYRSTAVFTDQVRCFRAEFRNGWYSLSTFYTSTALVALLEAVLFAGLIISPLAYFVTGQHSADDFGFNGARFATFTAFLLLLVLYVQSLGHLVGVAFLDHGNLAAIFAVVAYLSVSMLNGFFVNTEINVDDGGFFSDPVHTVTNLVALKFISRGLVYAIYGIDRCLENEDSEEESVVLQFLSVDVDTVWSDCLWVLGAMVFLRATTVGLIYAKFASGTGGWNWLLRRYPFGTPKIGWSSTGEVNGTFLEIEPSPKQQQQTTSSNNSLIIAWRHLTLFASPPTLLERLKISPPSPAQKTILRRLNGHLRRGTLTGLLGSSGAGKTSLLKVLSGQVSIGRLGPETELYTSQRGGKNPKTAFITQDVDGHLLTGLTVRHSIAYASRLKNIKPSVDHDQVVEQLATEMALNSVLDVRVEQLSGGERKRVALALELSASVMPELVVLDEVTSGLDSTAAEMVIRTLQQLTRKHSIQLSIIASIHMPTSPVLRLFDQLYVLAPGGSCLFAGPPQELKDVLKDVMFDSRKGEEGGGTFSSSIELMICLSCGSSEDSKKKMAKLIERHDQTEELLQLKTLQPTSNFTSSSISFSLRSSTILLQRTLHLLLVHRWRWVLFCYATYIGYGLFLRLFFNFEAMVAVDGCINIQGNGGAFNLAQGRCGASQSSLDSLFLVMDNLRYTHFFAVFYLTFVYLQAAFDLQDDLVIFVNERRNGWYSTTTFYLVKCLSESFPLLLLNLFYVHLTNYYSPIKVDIYWHIYLVLSLASLGFQGLAHIFSLLSRGNVALLTIISISISLLAVLLDDYLVLSFRLPLFYQLLSHLSIPRFVYEALIMLQYGFGRCGTPTSESEGSTKSIQSLFYLMQITDEDYVFCLLMLVANLLLYRAIVLFLLLKKANR